MRFLRDASIRIKVLIPPAIFVLALAVVSALAIYGMNQQYVALKEAHEIALKRIRVVDDFVVLSEQVQSDVFRISVLRFMNLPPEEIQPVTARLAQGLSDLNIVYGEILVRWTLDPTEREILGRMKPPLDEFRQQALQASVVVADDPALGVQLVRSSTVPFAEFRGTLAEFLDYQDTRIAHVVAESAQTAQNLSALIVALAFLITLGAALVTTQIGARLIAQPIRSITAVMHRLATGDLTVETDGLDQQDEIGAMARAVEVFRQNAIEKAQLDGELRVSEERYRLLFQHSPAGVFQYDTELRITDCNERLAAILQSTFQLLVGLDLNTLSDQSVLPALRQALAGEEGSYEGRYRATTGPARVWVSLHTTPLFDLQGRVTGGIALVEDISARKQAEQARERLIGELQEALAQVKTLGGLLPICASCKKIRDDQGYWNQIEAYIEAHSEAEFTHGICPECARRLYPESFPPSTTPGADRPA